MSINRNPLDVTGANDELLALPAHPTPWLDTGYRDENARLLVDAMYRHRDALLGDYGDVPVQGYAVFPGDQASGGLTCGTLISLWRGSALCRGECPLCGDQALALTVGGDEVDWLVVGVCRYCGHVMYRPGARRELLAELDRALEQTRYTLPGDFQLLNTNAHQHLALLEALSALGAALLPAPHYGFLASTPKAMQGWANPVRARAWHWVWNAIITHKPTGALVERTPAVLNEVTDFVEWHLLRTGRLPELTHEGPAQLRYEFPMISQEPVVQAPRPSAELSAYAEAVDGDTHQVDVDALIASVRARRVDADALQRVTEWLTATDAAQEWSGDGEVLGLWLSPNRIAAAYAAIDDHELREALELGARQRVTRAQRIEYLEQYVLPTLCDDADETQLFVPVQLRATDGDELTMVAGIQGYSFTEITTEWWGPVESAAAFREQLERWGWGEGVEGFEKLAVGRKVELVTGRTATSHCPTPPNA